MPWSRAKQLFDMITAEREEHDRVERKRIDEQMDAERDARMWPVTAFELRQTQLVLVRAARARRLGRERNT